MTYDSVCLESGVGISKTDDYNVSKYGGMAKCEKDVKM